MRCARGFIARHHAPGRDARLCVGRRGGAPAEASPTVALLTAGPDEDLHPRRLDDTLRTLECFTKLSGHDVEVWNDHVQDVDVLAERLRETEALVLIRERAEIRAPLLRRLPHLRLISHATRGIVTGATSPA